MRNMERKREKKVTFYREEKCFTYIFVKNEWQPEIGFQYTIIKFVFLGVHKFLDKTRCQAP